MTLEQDINSALREVQNLPDGVEAVLAKKELVSRLRDLIPALDHVMTEQDTFDANVVREVQN